MSPRGGVPKQPQGSILVGPQGVEDDYHSGPVNRHKKKGEPEPNTRQVTLLAQEVLDGLNARLAILLKPGGLGENILVTGLGDLSELKVGDRLRLGPAVILEVSAQNRPCDSIRVYHPALPEAIAGRRGVTAVVVAGGRLRPGDACRVLAT
ncbi:MAG: MOSC domain-containing protein [Chloroflexi bacterium]|nr:MOSC domain-containing protein [Chloroflexota bacterium]